MNSRVGAKLDQAITDLKAGKPIMLYDFDGREEETDLIYYGPAIDPRAVAHLRQSAGAPLSVYVNGEVGKALGLDTFLNMVKGLEGHQYDRIKRLAAPAGDFDPRFSITLDHRSNKTGCSHLETAKTIQMLSRLIARDGYEDFESEFRSPGHVPLIIAADGLLHSRRGHTELILSIGKIGGLLPLMVASEILDTYSCQSLSKERSMEYAEQLGLVYLTGLEVSDFALD
jgi:3,4-dihydroxy 2-butanone 4-phosphate synthase